MFSLSQNLNHLFKRPSGSINFLDGLRAIFSIWVVTFHTVWFWGNYFSSEDLPGYLSDPYLRIFFRGVFGVNAFFVLSGFLITRLLIKEINKTGGIDFKRFYIRRLWRLWPAYICAVLIYLVTVKDNSNFIWANLLYVNNFLPYEHQAFAWGWSLAIEEQFYLVAPLFILWFSRIGSPKTKLKWTIFLFALALIIRAAIAHQHPEQGVAMHPTLNEGFYRWHFDHLYDKLWARFGELLCGVMIAFFYTLPLWAKIKKILILLTVIFIGSMVLNFPVAFDFGTPRAIFEVSVFQLLIPTGVSALILLGLLNTDAKFFKFLGKNFWYPLAQLSYSLYLIHPIVIHMYFGIMKPESQTSIDYLAIMGSMGIILCLSLCSSCLIYLFMERPFLNLRDKK